MKTKTMKNAERFAAFITAEEEQRKGSIARRRDDHTDARAALVEKRDERLKSIDDFAEAQKSDVHSVFAELIAAEDRRISACDTELRSMEAEGETEAAVPAPKKPNLKVAGE